jgi:5-methylcytosine-specific restriction endonuclease McrA
MPEISTVRQHIAWSYANLARAHAAISDGASTYKRGHHIIRSRLYKGLCDGTMSMRTVYDDERLKMTMPQSCVYCGSLRNLSLDHVFPRRAGGTDKPENLVWACRSCNSSKGDQDMMHWFIARGRFPSILVLRRYLKNVAEYCEVQGLMERRLIEMNVTELPFLLDQLPHRFPALSTLVLWTPAQTSVD